MEVLPPRAAFLGAPLAQRVEVRATTLAQGFIQSDQFQGLWVAANRQAHQRLMDSARQDAAEAENESPARLRLKLESLLASVRQKLGRSSQPLFEQSGNSNQTGNDVSIGIGLKSKLKSFKRFVTATDFLNSVLLLASFACLLGSLVLSKARRRLLMIITATLSTIALLQLIGVQVLRPEILNQIGESAYRPAVGVVYDTLLGSFKNMATSVFLISAAVFLAAYLGGRRFVKSSKWLLELKNTKLWKTLHQVRRWVAKYKLRVISLGALSVLLAMAFWLEFDWVGAIQAALVILIYVSLINLLVPTKQLRN